MAGTGRLWGFACAMVALSGVSLAQPVADDCHEEGKDPICGHFRATWARLLAADEGATAGRNAIGVADPSYGLIGPSPRPATAEADAATDVTHCLLDIELDPVAKTIRGTSTITVTSLVAGLTTFTLDLQANMVVDGVTTGGTAVAFARPGDTIEVALDRSYNAGESFDVAVAYHGSPINTGYASFDWGTHGGKPIASTLSEPWYAHTWWPCKDSLGDKFTSDVWVTVPNTMVVASNGLLAGTDTLDGNRLRYRWHESYPIATYLVSLAATNYVTWTQYYDHASGSMPVQIFAYPESEASVRSNTADLITQIATFSRADVYGEYPFINEKYGLAQFPWSGGMEHQTITSQGVFNSWINSHELSHQWWGDAITCGTWHDIWLNEGFATFSEAVYMEKKPGGSLADYRNWMINYRRPGDYSGTVYVYDATSMSAVFSSSFVYRKGAWVLHMLRHVVGDPTLFDILAAYRAAYQGGSAVTSDFEAIAESVSGRDLGWFFNEWVYGPGAPSYHYGWQGAQIGSQHYLRLHLEQWDTTYPVFAMPVDITVTAASGSVTIPVWNDAAWQWYLLPVNGPVSSVQFDADTWILRGSATTAPYVNGPPKLIRTSPARGARVSRATGATEIVLGFSEGIAYTDTDFRVIGARSGPQPATISYDPATYTVTLHVAGGLAGGDTYTVTARDSVTSSAAGVALDGEMPARLDPTFVASGDGKPGGDAVVQFSVASFGDFDLDGDVDLSDFSLFADCFNGPNRPSQASSCSLDADYDGDNDIDLGDFAAFQACFNGPNRAPACL
jgi:aminopeptidase N